MPVTFPNESPAYRAARDELLRAETDLRAQVERVAALRRNLPPGGALREDYEFRGPGGVVRLSQLFGDKPTLLVYNFMFSPDMASACPGCTSILDAWNGQAPQLMTRVALAVVARNPVEKVRAYAARRGWNNLPLYSSADCAYNADYHGESGGESDGANGGKSGGEQMPMANIFARGEDGVIRHCWGSELLYAPSAPGQHPRHMDLAWPLWNLLDLTPEGRGAWPPLPDGPGKTG